MNILEKDVIMGTFTNQEKYLSGLCKSIRKNLSHIPFTVQLADLPINKNFNSLRETFIKSNKRFWIFLDHDIEFLFPDTVEIALKTLISNKFGLVGVYSTFNPNFFKRQDLEEREVGWIPGYFQLVDSRLVGHIKADENLPDPNTSIDTSYCVQIKQCGYKIGIAPTYVYHVYKGNSWMNQEMIEPTNRYLEQKYGKQYFEWCRGFDNIIGNFVEEKDAKVNINSDDR